MTQYNTDKIKTMRRDIVGRTVTNFYYEADGDYFVIDLRGADGSMLETSFRFMADLSGLPHYDRRLGGNVK